MPAISTCSNESRGDKQNSRATGREKKKLTARNDSTEKPSHPSEVVQPIREATGQRNQPTDTADLAAGGGREVYTLRDAIIPFLSGLPDGWLANEERPAADKEWEGDMHVF